MVTEFRWALGDGGSRSRPSPGSGGALGGDGVWAAAPCELRAAGRGIVRGAHRGWRLRFGEAGLVTARCVPRRAAPLPEIARPAGCPGKLRAEQGPRPQSLLRKEASQAGLRIRRGVRSRAAVAHQQLTLPGS